jgi:hypothetical protein
MVMMPLIVCVTLLSVKSDLNVPAYGTLAPGRAKKINNCHIFLKSMVHVRLFLFTQITSCHVYLADFVL